MADYQSQLSGQQVDEILRKSKIYYEYKQNPHETKAPFLGKWRKERLNQTFLSL